MNLLELLAAAENAVADLECPAFLPFELDGLVGTLAAHRRTLLHHGTGLHKLKDASATGGPVELLQRVEDALSGMLTRELSVGDRRVIAGAFFCVEAVKLTVADALAEEAMQHADEPPYVPVHLSADRFVHLDLRDPLRASQELANLAACRTCSAT